MAWKHIASGKPGRRTDTTRPALTCNRDGVRHFLLPLDMVTANAANIHLDEDRKLIGIEMTPHGDRTVQTNTKAGEPGKSTTRGRARISVGKAIGNLLPDRAVEIDLTTDPATGFYVLDLATLGVDEPEEAPEPEPTPEAAPVARVPDFTFEDEGEDDGEDDGFGADPVTARVG